MKLISLVIIAIVNLTGFANAQSMSDTFDQIAKAVGDAQRMLVQQQQACAPLTNLLAEARQRWGEGPTVVGQIDDGSVMKLLVSAKGSWTVLHVMPMPGRKDDMACVLATGDGLFVEGDVPKDGKGM